MGFIGDIKLLERVQRRLTRSIEGLGDIPCDERLKKLDLFSLKGRLLRADLIQVWKIFSGNRCLSVSDFFVLDAQSRTRGHPFKIFVQRAYLDMRKRMFSVRVDSTWNSLSLETVMSENLQIFKHRLKNDLGNRLYDFV